MCSHHLGGRTDGLTCICEAPHDETAAGGHEYQATWAADIKHDDITHEED